MKEETPSNECYACNEKLVQGARRCSKCHAWQGWRRYTGELNLLTVVSAVASAVAILLVFVNKGNIDQRVEDIENNFLYSKVYEQWSNEHRVFLEKHGMPSGKLDPISILHYQFFEDGYVLLTSSGWSVAFNHAEETFSIMDNPEQLISLYDPTKIDTDLLCQLHCEERYDQYLNLFKNGEITGGIGTLYVKYNLASKIGRPNGKEMAIKNAAYMRGQNYDLLVGAINRPTDESNSSIRAVYALFHNNNSYKRYPVDVGSK